MLNVDSFIYIYTPCPMVYGYSQMHLRMRHTPQGPLATLSSPTTHERVPRAKCIMKSRQEREEAEDRNKVGVLCREALSGQLNASIALRNV